jgi:hypothetical protein
MSLSNQVSTHIKNIIDIYISSISEKYNIDHGELQNLWTGDCTAKAVAGTAKAVAGTAKAVAGTAKAVAVVDMKDLSIERLMKCTKPELAALCKSNGKKCTGKKDELIERLRGNNSQVIPDAKPVQVSQESKIGKTDLSAAVFKNVISNVLAVSVRTNCHGNTEHPQTRLVFDKKNKKVIGRQEDDGTVSDLCDEDIENCKKYKFPYDTPTNLDTKESLKKVKLQEVEEGFEEDIVEEEIDIEEEQEVDEEVASDDEVEVEEEEEEIYE